MNICMVGHGMMGVWHSEALRGADCTLHTVVGRRPEPTSAFAQAYGFARWTTDYRQALYDPAVEAVIVAGPSETHAPMALEAIGAGKPVLVEIPLAMNLRDAERVVAAGEAAGLPVGVVHPMRFRREHRELVARVAAGAERVRHVGARIFMHRYENVGATGYRRSWTDNLLWHHGAHLVDVSLWLLGGGDPAAAAAALDQEFSFMPRPDERTGIPMEVVVTAASGRTGQSMACTGSYASRERKIDVFAVTDRDGYDLDVLASALRTGDGTRAVLGEQDNNAQAAPDFVAALREGRPPLVTARSVLPAMQVLQRAQDRWDAAQIEASA